MAVKASVFTKLTTTVHVDKNKKRKKSATLTVYDAQSQQPEMLAVVSESDGLPASM